MTLFRIISHHEKLNFCNFFIHFPCLSAPAKIQTFWPFQSILRTTTFPIKIPCVRPDIQPFQGGILRRRNLAKYSHVLSNISPFREPFGQAVFNQEIIQFYTQMMPFLNKNTSSLATALGEPGEISEGRMGRKGRCFCTKKSLNWDVSGG